VAIKLYYGGFGDYKDFVAAESEPEAIEALGKKLNAPFLPIFADEVTEVDGYSVSLLMESPIETEKCEETTLRHCKKCDFMCETQGQLLQHYRECHPKGD